MQVVLGQAGLHHRQQRLEVLGLLVVGDRLVGIRQRQAHRAVVALDEARRERRRGLRLAHGVPAATLEHPFDGEELEPPAADVLALGHSGTWQTASRLSPSAVRM